MDIFSIFTLCGGLAFFLYGISNMSIGLEKIAGGKLEKILKQITSNQYKGFLFGLGVTAAIQSSSAVTVVLVGLVNSGVMKLSQTVGVIIGTNVGTTVTAWILSLTGIQSTTFLLKLLKPESFSPLLALLGIIMIMGSRNSKRKSWGNVLVSFAILMFGMELMASSMSPLADMPAFQHTLVAFSNPLLGLIIGLIVTMIIQSSSASIGILQALTMVGGISYGICVPIILGQNLGTCISAVLSCIGVNTNAKRVAGVHVIYNILSVALFFPIFVIANSFFSVKFFSQFATPFGIAVVHSVYNILTALIFFPFCKMLENLSIRFIPENDTTEKTVLVDERLLLSPNLAISECFVKTVRMAELVEYNFKYSTKLLKSFHKKKAEQIEANEILIDKYEDKLNAFLLKLSAKELSEYESNKISQLLLAIGDYERIGDHTSYILKMAETLNDTDNKLSNIAIDELKVIVHAVSEIFMISFEAYRNDNFELAQEVEALESVIKKLVRKVKNNHIQRLKEGHCTSQASFMYTDLLNDLRRIAAHCGNIATSVVQLHDNSIDKHEYSHRNKNEDIQFISKYEDYKSRYKLVK